MLTPELLLKAYQLMVTAKSMCDTYDANRQICKYVHSTSRGHEAIQLATGMQLLPCDWVSPYYRDDSIMLSIGFQPYELMLQLLAKKEDPFSGGRSYYCHPSSRDENRPSIIHQSSATGMQTIPTTGLAQGIQYLERIQSDKLRSVDGQLPIVICSLGDGSVTEGEVSEALQFAVLKQLPIIYLVQDNQWSISASAEEVRAMNAYDYAQGFKGLRRWQCDGSDFIRSYETMTEAIAYTRAERKPALVHAKVPLLGHHTSGVRREFYRSREDLLKHGLYDPLPKLRLLLTDVGIAEHVITDIEKQAEEKVLADFQRAQAAPDPDPRSVAAHVFAPTPVTEEKGQRSPKNGEKVLMVDAALHAIEELMEEYPEAILYGQDVGARLGGVFREAATLGEKFGEHRVFNTAIQEAYIVGSTAGLSALGIKPMVEVQFADYIYPGFNQLVTELSKSCYLSNGKFPVGMVLRVPTGAYGGGGPYHSGSVESTLLTIKGIKVVYPSNTADMKGLLKAAFHDPNPVVMLEHKGLYWSKVPGTEDAKMVEPSKDYLLPLGKANIVLAADTARVKKGETVCVITYGMGVYWAKAAAAQLPGQVEIVDLRTLYPLDEEMIFTQVKKHGKVLVLSEEQQNNSFAEALALRITNHCYHFLDARVEVMGALNLPAVPINLVLEAAMLPNAQTVKERIAKLLAY
ncbi:MAG: tungsten formylmethanofuran dehydrogenase [Sediminibacterium sp. Gen4]|jgi:2-oxoisovalerate dehydrogenase E1 component|uniref:alpha-ketoacid dehydrogenase subunit alpha/beta n=1 Tax=unclassified Sediminibacterium TaxID=2635961 RepID=UPI0015B9D463|nr:MULTISPECIES: alpha-ketoacid dehydrogenase subunit alpha/beta [unclassified Sediminibacterium]MBW0161181.1 tungsten formylmethanofuran dehydrogenase [Sediminibacterium sp.]MBW0165444.1 tungsten formylmethanofuran dehydrogenase [Sediminibacterium sp.]NWK65387.1 tungsten formylmethanofuran dehydrogenase [Sediminibacterium sp. Gen4]